MQLNSLLNYIKLNLTIEVLNKFKFRIYFTIISFPNSYREVMATILFEQKSFPIILSNKNVQTSNFGKKI